MRIVLVFALVASCCVFADDTCVRALQRCYDSNYYPMEKLVDDDENLLQNLPETCEFLSKGLTCMETLKCRKSTRFLTLKKKLTKDMLAEVEGGCNPDGTIDDCAYTEIKCAEDFFEAESYFKSKDIKHGCADLLLYEDCVSNSKNVCSSGPQKEMKSYLNKLDVEGHRAGCNVNCIEALKSCTYQMKVADDDDYCSAYTETRKCLAKMVDNAGCKDADSQKYLKEAIKFKGQRYKLRCNGGSLPAQASLFSVLSTLAVVVLGRWFQ